MNVSFTRLDAFFSGNVHDTVHLGGIKVEFTICASQFNPG